MPFAADASLVSTDVNNMLRGLFRNNSDIAVTGTTVETDLGTFTVTGGTITATGELYFEASGTLTGSAGTKTIRLYFGGTSVNSAVLAATDAQFEIQAWVINTASNAQRILIRLQSAPGGGGITTNTIQNSSTAADTSANQIIKVTGQLTNAADTITEKTFNLFVVQIT